MNPHSRCLSHVTERSGVHRQNELRETIRSPHYAHVHVDKVHGQTQRKATLEPRYRLWGLGTRRQMLRSRDLPVHGSVTLTLILTTLTKYNIAEREVGHGVSQVHPKPQCVGSKTTHADNERRA